MFQTLECKDPSVDWSGSVHRYSSSLEIKKI